MKITFEVMDGDKNTKYTADFEPTEEALKNQYNTFLDMLKKTFKKEVYVKQK